MDAGVKNTDRRWAHLLRPRDRHFLAMLYNLYACNQSQAWLYNSRCNEVTNDLNQDDQGRPALRWRGLPITLEPRAGQGGWLSRTQQRAIGGRPTRRSPPRSTPIWPSKPTPRSSPAAQPTLWLTSRSRQALPTCHISWPASTSCASGITPCWPTGWASARRSKSSACLTPGPAIKRVLIVCPASLKLNWLRRLTKWLTTPRKIGIIDGTFPQTDIVIINYDILTRHRAGLMAQTLDLMVADKSHKIKNDKAQQRRALLGKWSRDKDKLQLPVQAKRKIFMTRTPIANRPVKLWDDGHRARPQQPGRQLQKVWPALLRRSSDQDHARPHGGADWAGPATWRSCNSGCARPS